MDNNLDPNIVVKSTVATPLYTDCFERGLAYQDFVVHELYRLGLPLVTYSSKKYQVGMGETSAGIEIKLDSNIRKYGNLYIETQERKDESLPFSPGGIYRDDNTWLYVIGDYQSIFIMSKAQLILTHQSNKLKMVEKPTSIGMLLPVERAMKFLVLKRIDFDENGKVLA